MPLSFQMETVLSVLIIQPHYIIQNDLITLWRPHVRDNNDNTFAPWHNRRVIFGRLGSRRNNHQAIPSLNLSSM